MPLRTIQRIIVMVKNTNKPSVAKNVKTGLVAGGLTVVLAAGAALGPCMSVNTVASNGADKRNVAWCAVSHLKLASLNSLVTVSGTSTQITMVPNPDIIDASQGFIKLIQRSLQNDVQPFSSLEYRA